MGNGRVLRRYRDGRPAERVAGEAGVMRYAREHRVPVPEVFDVSGSDIVMARAAGPTMLQAIAERPWTVRRQARLLARLHALVHTVPAIETLHAPFDDDAGAPGDNARPGPVLLHIDLHPQNVILTADGPVIIDWEGAARGPAVADVAMTWVIVRFSQIPGSRLKAAAFRLIQVLFTRAFLAAAGPLDDYWRSTAIRRRLDDPNLLPVERARLEREQKRGRERVKY
jgi:Ser/Thr protein kinase RdoA (MazF antagonist)